MGSSGPLMPLYVLEEALNCDIEVFVANGPYGWSGIHLAPEEVMFVERQGVTYKLTGRQPREWQS